ncbi:MAG: tyrosine-protein phosphatase [Bosea sp. (in: a-proteobacteria)]
MTIEPFTIATLTLANGARIGICRLPGRSGDLAGDVARIADWDAALVVSMTEADEMAAKGAGGLDAALYEASIGWRHFPIKDYGAPADADTRWPPLSRELHAALDQGKAVLLHCAGGKGRSGMVALRLLTERGVEPEAALAMIRDVRPGAIETEEQVAWGSASAI